MVYSYPLILYFHSKEGYLTSIYFLTKRTEFLLIFSLNIVRTILAMKVIGYIIYLESSLLKLLQREVK